MKYYFEESLVKTCYDIIKCNKQNTVICMIFIKIYTLNNYKIKTTLKLIYLILPLKTTKILNDYK